MHYYRIDICETGAALFSSDYSVFNTESIRCQDLNHVKNVLRERYGHCKKSRLYVDGPDGEPVPVGWVYCFRNADVSHPGPEWNQRDWVDVREVTETTVDVGEL